MELSRAGNVARDHWLEIPNHFRNVRLDAFTVMPNHVHGIIAIQGNDENADGSQAPGHELDQRPAVSSEPGTTDSVSDGVSFLRIRMSRIAPNSGSLSAIIRSYKASVTRECTSHGLDGFAWQPRFHDRIVRDEGELQAVREYIMQNPLKWALDQYNPVRQHAFGR